MVLERLLKNKKKNKNTFVINNFYNFKQNLFKILPITGGHSDRVMHFPFCQIGFLAGQMHPAEQIREQTGRGFWQVATQCAEQELKT